MTEHKIDINITKYKKLIMTEHKIDINITKIEKIQKTKHEETQNRHEHY